MKQKLQKVKILLGRAFEVACNVKPLLFEMKPVYEGDYRFIEPQRSKNSYDRMCQHVVDIFTQHGQSEEEAKENVWNLIQDRKQRNKNALPRYHQSDAQIIWSIFANVMKQYNLKYVHEYGKVEPLPPSVY